MSRPDELEGIEVRSGVNDAGNGFCTIVVTAGGGRMLLGQLDPTEVRKMALAWLETAEAAEQDAAVLRLIRKLELPDQIAGLIITELRDSRNQDE
jgi:hypothetical protein